VKSTLHVQNVFENVDATTITDFIKEISF